MIITRSAISARDCRILAARSASTVSGSSESPNGSTRRFGDTRTSRLDTSAGDASTRSVTPVRSMSLKIRDTDPSLVS